MSCRRFRDAITDHACGGTIAPDAAAHVAACAACRDAVEVQRRLLAEVDAELGRGLAVSASPGFVDRVLADARAVDNQPAPWPMPAASWVGTPTAAWVGLAAAALIAVAVFLRSPQPPPRREAAAPVSASAAATPAISPTAAALPRSQSTTGRIVRPVAAAARPPRRVAAAPAVGPPVIVGPHQARAIARLRELLATGALTDTMLPPARRGDDAFAELKIAPLVIPDIVVPDVEIAGRGSASSPERQ